MRLATLVSFFSLVVLSASAQVEIVADIYPGSEGSWPTSFTVFQGELYFRASDPTNGGELWRYDGQNASLAIDLVPGLESGRPSRLQQVGEQLFFLSDSEETGPEPWLSNGETAFLVKDIWPGSQGMISNFYFAVMDDRVFFRGNDGTHGFELWVVEADSARQVEDINPGLGDAWIEDITVYNGEVFFHACIIEWDCELWATDGNDTRLVSDIVPGGQGSFPKGFVVFSAGSEQTEALYFTANGSVWMTDGADVDLAPGFEGANYFNLSNAREYNGSLYMYAHTDSTGDELWRYDGSQVEMVADLEPGEGGSYPYPIGVFDDALYVATCNWDVYPELSTCRLWEVRGDEIQEMGSWIDSGPQSIVEWRGKLYFTTFDDELGSELWVLEENGAELVIDLYPGPESGAQFLTLYNDQLYFRGNDGVSGRELWRVLPHPTADEELPESLSSGLIIYPNPVSEAAVVGMDLTTAQSVRLELIDALGRLVAVLHDGSLAAGTHSLLFSVADVASGVYVVRADFGKAGVASRTVTVFR